MGVLVDLTLLTEGLLVLRDRTELTEGLLDLTGSAAMLSASVSSSSVESNSESERSRNYNSISGKYNQFHLKLVVRILSTPANIIL